MKTKSNKHTINVVTLGCSKNTVDSESLMRQLDANGLKVVHDENLLTPTVIINTCGFIQDAREESVDTILRFAKAKESGEISNLFVMGCLSQRYKKELEKEIPEVDRFFGVNDIETVIRSVGYDYKKNLAGERLLTTPSHFAYLKISEGCDRQCSFCAIPLIRGKHRSKPLENIVSEAENLVRQNVKELILIAQDLTYYGVDLYKSQKLHELLQRLSDIEGIEWIRLHYAYPASFPKDILKLMRERSNICNYLDIPFQHISNPVLQKMRRSVTARQTYDLIDALRDQVPGLVLRTTLMVGHPGEGETEFHELVEFVEKTRFNRLGVFTYSEEENTYGARNFQDTVPAETKMERASHIMDIQQGISLALNQSLIGRKMKVVIDRFENNYYIGRTEGDSPEVDNEVLIGSEIELKPGNFYLTEITGANDFDLEARVI